MATDANFIYSTAPLDPLSQEIRLVELLSNEESERPTCALRPYPVDGPHPPFTALSYAWGATVRYDDITLNGRRFPVGRNLWYFLGQMRVSKQFGMYWIDALSINQSNVKERNHQVQMMRKIYSNAESVIAWLGIADTDALSNAAMNFLTKRESLQPENNNIGRFWTPRQAKAVLALCERAYWTRIWIVQELLLSNAVTIHCGSKAMLWRHLQRFVDDATDILPTWGQHLRLAPALDSAAANIVRTKSGWSSQRPQPLRALIQLCRGQQSTDVRDKIYALHGLASDTDNLAVDYSITARQLLDVALEHTCTSFGSGLNVQHSRKQILRIGQLLRDILRVVCHDQELEVLIDAVEQRMSLDDELRRAEEARIKAREVAKHTMEKARTERPWSNQSTQQDGSLEGRQGYCFFAFLHCPFRSLDPFEWSEHCTDHFLLEEPPLMINCSLCDIKNPPAESWIFGATYLTGLWTCDAAWKFNSHDSGWSVWYAFLEHIQKDHHAVLFPHDGIYLWSLLRRLAESNIINEEEFKVLDQKTVLTKIPSRYARAAGNTEEKDEKPLTDLQCSLRAREKVIAQRIMTIYEAGGKHKDASELFRVRDYRD